MEELANLIFIGCYVAKCGPPGFKSLWMRLQPAMWHYLYGKDDTADQRCDAERSLKHYAARLEKYVIDGQVNSCFLQRPDYMYVAAAAADDLWPPYLDRL